MNEKEIHDEYRKTAGAIKKTLTDFEILTERKSQTDIHVYRDDKGKITKVGFPYGS